MRLLPPRRTGGGVPTAGGRPRAPLPSTLPGDFFVLAWDRDRQVFVLVVDDADASNYNLGGDTQVVMQRFRMWGLKEVGYRAVDMAREFGMVQVISEEGRIIRLTEREDSAADVVTSRLKALEEQEHGNVRHLPTLRSAL